MYDSIKTALSDYLHLSRDALHLHIGFLILVAASVLTRRSLASWLPWSILLAFELINEWFDLAHHLGRGGIPAWALLGSCKDIVNTMVWPTVLMIGLRLGWPATTIRPRAADGAAGAGAGGATRGD